VPWIIGLREVYWANISMAVQGSKPVAGFHTDKERSRLCCQVSCRQRSRFWTCCLVGKAKYSSSSKDTISIESTGQVLMTKQNIIYQVPEELNCWSSGCKESYYQVQSIHSILNVSLIVQIKRSRFIYETSCETYLKQNYDNRSKSSRCDWPDQY